jgi:hypothetical protein
MKILHIAPLNDKGYPEVNKKGDKRFFDFFKTNFNEKSVIVLHRSTSRKAMQGFKVIFLKDEDANFLQLIVDKKAFLIKEFADSQVTIY